MAELVKNTVEIPTLQTEEKTISPWKEAWQSFYKNRLALAGLIIVVFFIILAIIAPLAAPYSYDGQTLTDRLQPPSSKHWFGTDDFGRDIFSRVVYGARISLWVGFFSVLGSVIAGTLLGIIAGYYGRWVDTIISRVFDVMLAFPSILLAIAVVAILGPSLQNALIAIAVINIPNFGDRKSVV